MSNPHAINCRRLAAHYQALATQPALLHFREGFAQLAAAYAAIAARLEAAENVAAALDDRHDGA